MRGKRGVGGGKEKEKESEKAHKCSSLALLQNTNLTVGNPP